MTQTVREDKKFKAPRDVVFSVIENIESYSEFMAGVSSVEVTKESGDSIFAEYRIDMIKSFRYVLEHKLERPGKLSWKFVEGDLFKHNSGSWTLDEVDDEQTSVIYELDVGFNLFVPKMVVNKMVKTNLPSMLSEVEKRAIKLWKKTR